MALHQTQTEFYTLDERFQKQNHFPSNWCVFHLGGGGAIPYIIINNGDARRIFQKKP